MRIRLCIVSAGIFMCLFTAAAWAAPPDFSSMARGLNLNWQQSNTDRNVATAGATNSLTALQRDVGGSTSLSTYTLYEKIGGNGCNHLGLTTFGSNATTGNKIGADIACSVAEGVKESVVSPRVIALHDNTACLTAIMFGLGCAAMKAGSL